MNRRRQPPRRGAVLVAAVVCLLIALSITTTMLTQSLLRRVQLNAELNARQAELLVQAGQGRAAAKLAADADYAGEWWAPSVGAAADVRAAVEITIEPTDDGAMQVEVVAIYPDGDPKAVRRSHVFLLTQRSSEQEE